MSRRRNGATRPPLRRTRGSPPLERRRMTHLRAAAFLVAASVFIPTALSAQASTGSVTGRVTAAGEGVSGAAVLATGTGRGVQTRQDGSYRLVLPPGRYELRARAVGYTSARDSIIVAAGGTYLMNFALEKSITSLEAVSTLGARGEAPPPPIRPPPPPTSLPPPTGGGDPSAREPASPCARVDQAPHRQ